MQDQQTRSIHLGLIRMLRRQVMVLTLDMGHHRAMVLIHQAMGNHQDKRPVRMVIRLLRLGTLDIQAIRAIQDIQAIQDMDPHPRRHLQDMVNIQGIRVIQERHLAMGRHHLVMNHLHLAMGRHHLAMGRRHQAMGPLHPLMVRHHLRMGIHPQQVIQRMGRTGRIQVDHHRQVDHPQARGLSTSI